MRLLIIAAMAASLCLGLTGCLCTKHIDRSSSSNTTYDCEGRPTSETHVEANERKWLGLWPAAVACSAVSALPLRQLGHRMNGVSRAATRLPLPRRSWWIDACNCP